MSKYKFLIINILILFCNIPKSLAQDDSLWKLHTSDLEANYVGASLANGGIGILPWKEPFSVQHVILNHVFDKTSSRGISKVLRGINPFLLEIQLDGKSITPHNISRWEQSINMKEATHDSHFFVDQKAEISYSICALRNMPYVGLIRVTIRATEQMTIKVSNQMVVPDEYIKPYSSFNSLNDSHGSRMDIFQTSAISRYKKLEVAASSAFLFTDSEDKVLSYDEDIKKMSFTHSLKKGETFTFALVGSICSQRDFIDPHNESERQITYAIHEGVSRLMNAHCNLWNEMWQSDIIIDGDDDAQRVVRFALFNLYSSVRQGSRLSTSPMGLSSQGYNGHIFWDTELWIYPPMLVLNQEIAKSMVDYRIDRLQAACKRAGIYGYKGAMYPWESDDAGQESTPTFAITGPFEHHITADIAIACWNYYRVTDDRQWLISEGFPLLRAVADFWVSRSEKNKDGSYSIRNVVGADEYASGADDNAFTNGAAICALEYAHQAALVCGYTVPHSWVEIKDKLQILSFPNGVTREHAAYDGELIKQADANLLAYPLGIITDKNTWKKDLEYYVDKIDQEHGPAMSYSIFSIQYARLGDSQKAYEMFQRSYQPNLRPPFGVIAETPASNNPYFVTGAGGLLQAVINGFCGLQITNEGIVQVPSVLPEHWKKLTITGVGRDKKTFKRVGGRLSN